MAASYEQTMLKLEKMAQANTATQMQWQEKMSKTSHQMEVNDLIAAGLNPTLSANQGANAYTTSVDSAVNGIANMASSKENANATRFAARQSAAATRAAAAAQIESARIAAEASKWNTAHSKSGNLVGVASNFFQDLVNAIKKSNSGIDSTAIKATLKDSQKLLSNQNKYLVDPNKSWSWKNITRVGKTQINMQLRDLGLTSWSPQAREWYINATYNGNKRAGEYFAAYLQASLKKSSNHAARLNYLRSVHS